MDLFYPTFQLYHFSIFMQVGMLWKYYLVLKAETYMPLGLEMKR